MERSLDPSQPASLVVTFIEERNGAAIVRLPNGSKTTVAFGALRPQLGRVHFVYQEDGGESAWCQLCDWHVDGGSRIEAEDEYQRHARDEHGPTP